jgi:phage terminase large subunit
VEELRNIDVYVEHDEPIIDGERIITGTTILERNAESTAQVICNIGGARSSKSYSIAQLLAWKLSNEKNKKFLITRKTMPALRVTAMREFINLLKKYDLYRFCEHNKTANTLDYPENNNWLLFAGLDDPIKIKSSDFNYIFMEEANQFTDDDYKQLKLRMSTPSLDGMRNQMFQACNPSDIYGWINQWLIHQPEVEVIHSTYKDNPFLSKDYVKLLEQLEGTDATYWQIYGLGLYAEIGELIYKPFTVIDTWPDSFDDILFGVDFGFNNPSAVLQVGIKDLQFYLKEIIYETHLTNSELIKRVIELVPYKYFKKPWYCDSAEPDRIKEFRQAGINAKGSFKGPNSVKDGIDYCKRQKIFSLKNNINLHKERSGYKWRKAANGIVYDEPVKSGRDNAGIIHDHLMDAMRYPIYTHFHKTARVGAWPSKGNQKRVRTR